MVEPKEIVTDVAIVGSGGAGLAAAIEARAVGASVTIVEAAESLGRASIVSGGGCSVAGTPLQLPRGVYDTPDQAFEDWVAWGGDAADEPWARFYLEHSLNDLYLWTEDMGVRWMDLNQPEGNRVPRWHRPAEGGFGITSALIEAVKARGETDIFTGTEITRIAMADGRSRGLLGVHLKSGVPLEINSKTVVIATGGFNSNLEMILETRPDLKRFRIMAGAGLGATGAGHKFARDAGAYLTHMGTIWFYVFATPDHRDPTGKRGIAFRGTPGFIWVNQQGRRFHK